VGNSLKENAMSIPIFRTDDKALRTLGISPKAYGWLSVAVAWLTRGGWRNIDHLISGSPIWEMWGADAAITFFDISNVLEKHPWKLSC